MNEYLAKATDFTDLVKQPKPTDYPQREFECPVCKGHGKWNLKLNCYGIGQHFQAHCMQCSGWGWVDKQDADCVHENQELSQQKCRERGIKHWGNCYHVTECKKCGLISSYDSSG